MVTASASLGVLLVGCSSAGSPSASTSPGQANVETPATTSTATMPVLVGLRLDLALSDLEVLGIAKDDVELLGGGTLGVVDESNWYVCDQRPAAGETQLVNLRLVVERECPANASQNAAASDDAASADAEATPSGVTPSVVPSDAPEEPESPAVFLSAVRGDLADMGKDLKDLERALDEGGILRIAGNRVELSFNIGQLSSRVPPEAYAQLWSEQLSALSAKVDAIGEKLDNDGSPKQVKAAIGDLRTEIAATKKALQSYENSLD